MKLRSKVDPTKYLGGNTTAINPDWVSEKYALEYDHKNLAIERCKDFYCEIVQPNPTEPVTQADIHNLAKEKGWWDGTNHNIPEKLALIHSEVSETLESYRDGDMTLVLAADGKPNGFPSELADVVIRCMDLAGYLKIDLQDVISKKHAYNKTRPHRHGGKKC